MKMKDYTGYRKGKLVALKSIENITIKKRRVIRWLFRCDCGTEKVLDIHDVIRVRKNGFGTQSCGCSRRELQSQRKLKPPGIAAFNSLYKTYQERCAEKRNYTFDLTKEEFKLLLDGNCFYCGKEPSQIKKSKVSFYKYNGIDRVDNTLGYSISNCVSCCKECNSKKAGITVDIAVKMIKFLGVNKNA